jgi:hypothetical protein
MNKNLNEEERTLFDWASTKTMLMHGAERAWEDGEWHSRH